MHPWSRYCVALRQRWALLLLGPICVVLFGPFLTLDQLFLGTGDSRELQDVGDGNKKKRPFLTAVDQLMLGTGKVGGKLGWRSDCSWVIGMTLVLVSSDPVIVR